MPIKPRLLTHFSRAEVTALFKQGKRVFRSPYFDLLISPARYEYGRLLPITPKRIGSAPERNLLRRRLKAIFYEQQLYTLPVDIVLIAHRTALELSYQALADAVTQAIQSISSPQAKL